MKNKTLLEIIITNGLLIALGVIIAAHIVDGISYDSGWTLLIAVIVLSVFNAFLKPVLVLITFPLIILTFGIGLWFINALLFMLVSKLVTGFNVTSFSAAMWGSLVVSLVSLLVNFLIGPRRRPPPPPSNNQKINKNDVIDI